MRLLLSLCTALLLTGCYDSHFGEAENSGTDNPVTNDIAALKTLFAGTTVGIDNDLVISGIVTTSDRSENFYRSFCIEQDGVGVEVMAGIDHLHNDFPVGCRITLHLRGLALGESFGVLQIGRMPAPGSGFTTDYIGSKAALDTHLQRSSEASVPVEPTIRTIGALNPGMCGALVRIDDLRYSPEDLTEGIWSGYARFTDRDGNAIYTYVRPYADFAGNPIPQRAVTLTGILQYDAKNGGRYLLKLRHEDDCLY